jgi:hypothetical protein
MLASVDLARQWFTSGARALERPCGGTTGMRLRKNSLLHVARVLQRLKAAMILWNLAARLEAAPF